MIAISAATACGGDTSPALDGPPGAHDAGSADAAPDAGDKALACAQTFGSDLTPAFGRFDGTVLAVVPPGDESCALPNRTHLVVQATLGGVAYRLVVDVLSNQGSPDVLLAELDHPLVGSAWAEGWHTNIPLDYVTDLGARSPTFVATPEPKLVSAITAELELGAHISVFATSGATEPNSAHLVHRNTANADGAIVLHPDGASPHWLLMRFDEQTF